MIQAARTTNKITAAILLLGLIGFGITQHFGVIAQTTTVTSTRSILIVDTVADLANLTPIDGTLVRTKGYSTDGVGSALYRYHKTGRSEITANSVTYFNGGASDDYFELDASNGVIDVTQAGAVGDGIANDTAAFEAAITAANGAEIWLGSNTYLITSITSTLNIRMRGRGAAVKAHSSASGVLLNLTGRLEVDGVTFDGLNNVDVTGLLVAGLEGDEVIDIRNSEFRNLSSDTSAQALRFNYCKSANVDKCRFQSIRALADGTEGNSDGSAIGVYFSYNIEKGSVTNCEFEDINSRDALGDAVYEDADAIQINPGSGTLQTVMISHCHFKNCGKRAVKMSSKAGSLAIVEDSIIESSYVGTSDGSSEEGNAMFAAISLLGGGLVVSDTHVKGGAVGYFLEVGGSAVDRCDVSNCTHHPEYHAWANTNSTMGVIVTSTATNLSKINLSNFRSSGTWFGMRLANGKDIAIHDSEFISQHHCIDLTAQNLVVTGTTMKFANEDTNGNNPYGINIENGLVSGVVVGNVVDSLADGVYLATQSSSFQLLVTSNVFRGLTRNILSNFGGETAPDLLFSGNNPNTTVVD